MRTALFWVVTQRVVVIPYGCFGTTYRSHLQGLRIEEEIICRDVRYTLLITSGNERSEQFYNWDRLQYNATTGRDYSTMLQLGEITVQCYNWERLQYNATTGRDYSTMLQLGEIIAVWAWRELKQMERKKKCECTL